MFAPEKRLMKSILSFIAAGVLTIGMAISAFSSNVVVEEDEIRIRAEASSDGQVVTNGTKGEKFEIIETVAGTDGQIWYKINTNVGLVGYVRGDLVTVEQTEEVSSQVPAPIEAMPETPAKINGNAAVNIRSGAGKTYNLVAQLDPDTAIVLIGQTTDSAGNVWYQFRYDSENVEGYVRGDLVSVEFPEESSLVEKETREDYELVYSTDADGVMCLYLYDYSQNIRLKVEDILSTLLEHKDTIEEMQILKSELTHLRTKISELEQSDKSNFLLMIEIPIAVLIIIAAFCLIFIRRRQKKR